MSSTADVIPAWTSRSPRQVFDAYWLAYAAAVETEQWRWKGRFRALEWVLAGGPPPLDDVEHPSTREEVFTVLRVVDAQRRGSSDMAAWAAGLNDMLLWLVNGTGDPGFVVAPRHPDGTTPTEDELYAEMQADNPYKTWGPEERREARLEATRLGSRYRVAAERADEAQARYGVSGGGFTGGG